MKQKYSSVEPGSDLTSTQWINATYSQLHSTHCLHVFESWSAAWPPESCIGPSHDPNLVAPLSNGCQTVVERGVTASPSDKEKAQPRGHCVRILAVTLVFRARYLQYQVCCSCWMRQLLYIQYSKAKVSWTRRTIHDTKVSNVCCQEATHPTEGDTKAANLDNKRRHWS